MTRPVVEAFECETAAVLIRDEGDIIFKMVAHFDAEPLSEGFACPDYLTTNQSCLLLHESKDLTERWNELGLANGLVCSFGNSDSKVSGAIVAGTSADGEGTYKALEEQHKSSFSILASQVASLRENLLLGQKVREYVRELEQHQELLEQRVEERTSELNEEKLKLADAFNVISSSVRYASRIQRSLLHGEQDMEKVVADYFILWEPRDFVSGDIYWVGNWGRGFLIVLGDCTGHGVPGAFMTLIALGALERACSEIDGGEVSNLIARMHYLIQRALSQHLEVGESDDGIELGACYFVPGQSDMTFAGARFELYIVEDGDLSILKGTKKGIGYRGIPQDQAFAEHTINLTQGQSFYLTSDGLIDQIGGERQRAYGKNRFRQGLLEVVDQPMREQKYQIYNAFLEYQGEQLRRDDVAVIGFRI